MSIQPTRYYDEFLRYYEMAKIQQEECNLGTIPHEQGTVTDDLMRNVHLYDVVNRKYAGFTQILLDLWYGESADHPYAHKLHDVRKPICKSFNGVHHFWSLPEWLYVFIVHRVTGSGINYAKKPSGYNNTILPHFKGCAEIENMTDRIIERPDHVKIYTSVGYQFPAFPKPTGNFKLGGDAFLVNYAPNLARDLAEFLSNGERKSLRTVGEWLFKWNADRGLRAYRFQYAALIADIADFYPTLVDRTSHFYYGSNAKECISYLAKPVKRMKEVDFLDAVMDKIMEDTGAVPYDAEDVCCDFIRWIENYIRPGHDYDHLCRDSVWNSSTIEDHPYGRQKAMLDHGLICSFNSLNVHPSDNYVLAQVGMSESKYRLKVSGLD